MADWVIVRLRDLAILRGVPARRNTAPVEAAGTVSKMSFLAMARNLGSANPASCRSLAGAVVQPSHFVAVAEIAKAKAGEKAVSAAMGPVTAEHCRSKFRPSCSAPST